MAIKLLTLNIENSRHLARVCEVIAEHLPDIVCLQEVIETDCERLASSGYDVKYALSGRVLTESGAARNWGVATLSRVPVKRQLVSYYADDPRIRVLRVPNDACRVLIVTELEHEGRPYRIATTHFTWSPDGRINDQQTADFARLDRVLSEYPHYVLCGDFNAPRGGEMFGKFTGRLGLTDHLPASVTSTLDPKLHRVGTLNLAVDTIFSTAHYRVTRTRVLEGISDHKAILGLVER
ncbi:MAG TPA: endonuclease/exonuclease/phosphatase family protein [Steroidobacter sp.]|uniref:endonuclease/exonuclease/phosphatase family protein n=1 Tax=Steroidobacter sp. TaxID=1978227 RepID=UPI002EDAD2D5